MPRTSTAYTVRGIEPHDDPAWQHAPESLRRDYWRQVVRLVKDANEYERARGRDRFGRKLTPITRFTREHRHSEMGSASPYAPPLVPSDEASRTVAYFDGRAFATHAEFFWRNGFGRILGYHRRGAWNTWAHRHLPKRDVIGISPAALEKVHRRMDVWWDERRGEVKLPEAPKPELKRVPFMVPRAVPKVPVPMPWAAKGFRIPRITPPKIAVRGRTDIDNAVFGSSAAKERTRRAIAGGYHTGFSQKKSPPMP